MLLKADGLPTYHFAHVVDDHLMRVTHVIRGDEWLSSVPLHLALFGAIDAAVPSYAHIAPLQIQDGDSRRKLSKRKDVAADARFYLAAGFPADAVKAYLLTVATSRFEGWRKVNKAASLDDFPLSLKDLGASGALLDLEKLESISKSYFVEQPIDRLVAEGLAWATEFDTELCDLWRDDPGFLADILATQRANPTRPRKDLGKWSDFRPALGFFYDSLFARDADIDAEMNELVRLAPVSAAVGTIIEGLPGVTDAAGFAAMLREAAEAHGLNQSRHRAVDSSSVHISALYSSLKFLLCGKRDSMDIWVLVSTMGVGRAIRRLQIQRERF
ncbi:glutamate--tRNA ligase family protein (plasmid) [Paraburkholderia strydomiana]